MRERFTPYRSEIVRELNALGYTTEWRCHDASLHGVPQTRLRSILLAVRGGLDINTTTPLGLFAAGLPPRLGDVLGPLMGANKWEGCADWVRHINSHPMRVCPTIVGGSTKHGGADLGPTGSRKAWESLGVDGSGIADAAPMPGFEGHPRLTLEMVAALQGFPRDWKFSGKKTSVYRQIGNALPPPMAQALGERVKHILDVPPDMPIAHVPAIVIHRLGGRGFSMDGGDM
jgi:DNA (cytosine-5)-methyltransferase 1